MDRTMDQKMNGGVENFGAGVDDVASSRMEGIANKARDAKNRVSEMVGNVQIPAEVDEQIQALREQTQIALDRTEELVKRHPFYSILGAAAVGALVASFMSARTGARSYRH